ncbi:MAG: dihydrolipoamide acetyltransferase family protein [Candidatus Binatia bacterium]
MAVEVVMPKFGLTMQEGTIQQWFKAEGDAISKGEPLFEVETEKVLYEVEAPASGRVAKQLYPAEATVPCAAVIAVIAVGDEDVAAVAARYATRSAATPAHATAAAQPPSAASRAGTTAPATPAARKLAKDHGIDLATVAASGPGGRITREDVEALIARPPSGAPLRGMRKSIAERMFKSLQSTAQLTITTEADVTALVARREQLRAEFPLTYTDLIIEAVAKALIAHPRLNATAEADAVQQHADIGIGIAVALDEGLIVPVIRKADQKPLRQIAEESHALAEKARAGTLGVDEVSGGTFTVTNLGMYGIDAFTPILHTPQVAILGIGRIIEKPAVHDGTIVPRSMLVLSLTFDHRIVDGAPAAAFLRTLASYLQG